MKRSGNQAKIPDGANKKQDHRYAHEKISMAYDSAASFVGEERGDRKKQALKTPITLEKNKRGVGKGGKISYGAK